MSKGLTIILMHGELKSDLVTLSQVRAWLLKRNLPLLDEVGAPNLHVGFYAEFPDAEFAALVQGLHWAQPEHVALIIRGADYPPVVVRPLGA